jgi:hypothetical protein
MALRSMRSRCGHGQSYGTGSAGPAPGPAGPAGPAAGVDISMYVRVYMLLNTCLPLSALLLPYLSGVYIPDGDAAAV